MQQCRYFIFLKKYTYQWILLTLILATTNVIGQQLSLSRKSSYYSYIYEIKASEVEELFSSKYYKFPEYLLQSPLDSFPTDSGYLKQLPVGHYLFLKAEKNQLNVKLNSVNTVDVDIFDNKRDLVLFIHHKGKEKAIADANVTLNNKTISYHESTGTYNIPKSNKKGLLIIKTKDETAFFNLSRDKNNPVVRRITRRVSYSFPLRYLLYPFRKNTRLFRRDYDPPSKYKGYLVFSQPKYLPNDTLKWKGFITNKKGKPYNKPLDLSIHPRYEYPKNYNSKSVIPVTRGAYLQEIPLGDSLKLNTYYEVALLHPRTGKKVISNNFYLEDYQLDESTYNFRVEKESYNYGQSPVIFLSGKDANGFDLLDSKVTIKLSTTSIYDFKADTVFVADRLWEKKVPLDPLGETKITIPDSIFPLANVRVKVEAIFNNSNNETHDKTDYFEYTGNASWIECNLEKDTIYASSWQKGKEQHKVGRLMTLHQKDTMSQQEITFPFKGKLNPQVSSYYFKQGSSSLPFGIKKESSLFKFSGYRTSDSVFFSFVNPRKLPIRYTIYKSGNTIVEEGNVITLNKAILDQSDDSYHISLHYVWGGEPIDKNHDLHVYNKNLNISIDQPSEIYPGQKTDISIKVTDYNGNPLKDVNITARSVNSQFKKDDVPDVPYLGKYRRARPFINSFELESKSFRMNHRLTPKWFKTMGLDSIPYYSFIYPRQELILHYDSIGTSDAQFSPFVFYKGRQESIYMIYLDNQLLYYYDTDNKPTYSFRADTGYHEIRLRTRSKEYVLDSIYLKKGFKLDFSFDKGHYPKEVRAVETTPELTDGEKHNLNLSLLSVKNNFRNKTAYLWQDDNVFRFYPYYHYNDYQYTLGPFKQDTIHFAVKDGFRTSFLFEPMYDYTLSERVVKMIRPHSLKYPKQLPYSISPKSLGVIATPIPIELKSTQPIWEKQLLIFHVTNTQQGNGTLEFDYEGDSLFHVIRLSKLDSTFSERFYRGRTRKMYDLTSGFYQLLFVTYEGDYLLKDSIYIKPDGLNYYRFDDQNLRLIDSVLTSNEYGKTTEFFYKKTGSISEFTKGKGIIKGKVRDKETGEPLPFVNIVLLNGEYQLAGASSDFDGNYIFRNLPKGNFNLKASFVGYRPLVTQGISVNRDKITFCDVELIASAASLAEFEVMEYSIPLISKDATAAGGAITRMPGRSASSIASTVGGVIVRGSRSNANSYYIDGIKVRDSEVLPQSTIESESIEDEEEENFTPNSLRKNFKDNGYWQPNIITNEKGEANFKVTFPDNVTQWNAIALGMDAHKRSGIGFASTRSYKKLLGQLATPRFLCLGDQTKIVGKVANYTSTSEKVTTTFTVNENVLYTKDTLVKNSVIDYASITSESYDTLNVQYSIQRPDGYLDGEERQIPVFPVGVHETKGTFHVLNKDTTLQIIFNDIDSNHPVEVYADNTPLAPLLEEIQYLKDYPYQCMEQTASKLIGYLMEENINVAIGQSNKRKGAVKKLIRRLELGQNEDGGWGWWPNSKTDIWMTSYVAKALYLAQQNGYTIKKIDKAVQYLLWHIDVMNSNELLFSMSVLSDMDIELPYASHLKKVESDSITTYQQFMAVKIKQANEIPYSINPVLGRKKQTILGNYYWEGEDYSWYDNSNNLTQLAYQIIEDYDSIHPYLPRIRNYFLEAKGHNQWQNTVDKASIMQTILSGLMREYGDVNQPATIRLSGIEEKEIQEFPYRSTLPKGRSEMTIEKKGAGSIYFTTYQKHWNTKPSVNDSSFIVNTWFEKGGKIIDTLKAGQPIVLKTQLTVKKRAEFVMIEVPILAGCSYGNNESTKNYFEVHREYFKHKTSIFCEKLNEGEYTFSINLEPRFSGVYSLNPAKAELMYFPSFYGNNELQKIKID